MDIQEYEIMAPVGSRESLAAAIQAGAGSIYFGIGQLNMRSHSANHFTIEDLKEIAETCNERGIKTYLTVNTVIYGEDINAMREIIDAAKGCQYHRRHRQRRAAWCIVAKWVWKYTCLHNSIYRTSRR